MIFIGLGANLEHPSHGSPQSTCEAALGALEGAGVSIRRRSRWYRSAPVPASDQPWYVNGVAVVDTELGATGLLALLHRVEGDFGRRRRERNEARLLDLDLLVYHDQVSEPGQEPVLPHPRLAERAFVLLPLAELAPDWRHPATGQALDQLIRALPPDQRIEPIPE